MRVVLYETGHSAKALSPLSLTRPLFDIHIGGFTLLEAAKLIFKNDKIETITRNHLAHSYPHFTQNSHEATLFLNANIVPSLRVLEEIRGHDFGTNFLLVNRDDVVIGSYVSHVKDPHLSHGTIPAYVEGSASKRVPVGTDRICHLSDIIVMGKKLLGENLLNYAEAYRTDLHQNIPNVFTEEDISYENVSFNTAKGIIYIEKNVSIEPFTHLVGPLYIKSETQIHSQTRLEHSFIGTNTRIGGEVTNSTIEAYSNKFHHGFVGDSYLGSWVNLGGGTSTSNLKNSYGTITMNGVQTHEQFVGSIICDYVKTAINTSIYTGKVIGVNAHIYGMVTEDVPSFVNYISKDNMIICPLDVAQKTMERMKIRRTVDTTKEDTAMLSFAYAETEQIRKEKGATEGKLSF